MSISTIDAGMLKNAFLAGAKGLEAKKNWINELNVFPVPDGDTGTNMTLTIMAAAKEVAELENPAMDQLAKAISSGSLRGAMASQTDDIEEFVKVVIEYGDYVLGQTPEMLPVLKQAGVVDSGGQGLMQMVKGAVDGLLGKTVDFSLDTVQDSGKTPAAGAGAAKGAARTDIDTADIKFGYCTEFIINLEKDYTDKDEAELKSYLESIGDSLVVVSDDEIVKVHVHTNHPGLAFEKALAYGSLSRMKIDNMREEHQERVIQDSERLAKEQAAREQADKDQASGEEAPAERREYGFIAVSSGEGLSDIFRGIGADFLIEGGQTMNPSTEDILKAIDRVNAENIFILPNNKNIIMAAQQARDLTEDKNIIVIPSRTVPQGLTALVNFMPDLGPEENTQTMTEEMGNVRTAQITYAVRTTNIDGIDIEEGDIMALGDHGMLAVGKSVDAVALDAMKEMLDEECELVTIYYGADVPEHEAEALRDQTQKQYPDKEIELQYGGQPIYYYMISAE